MVGRRNRFRGYNSVRFVYAKGQTVRSGAVTLKFVINPQRRSYRVAVVVSRKVHKSAVVRNRIRRRVFEIVRTELEPNAPNLDLLFTVFQDSVASMPAAELRVVVVKQLNQALAAAAPTTEPTPVHGIVNP